MRKRISKVAVDSVRPGPRDVFLWDTTLKGFGLKVTPVGRRVYLVQFRDRGDRRLWRYTIGLHGAWTPDQARREAASVLGRAAAGENPARLKRDSKTRAAESLTVKELAGLFLADYVAVRTKPRTNAEYSRLIDKFLIPALGRRPAAEIARADIARFHHSLRRTAYQANRVLAVASKLFSWAERHGYITAQNPCKGVAKFKEQSRRRYLSESELARLGAALADAAASNGESPFTVGALRLLALSGARLSEILTLRWEHVDIEGACLRLLDSKSGAKTILLPPAALAVLEALPRVEGSGYVIPAERGKGHRVNLQLAWRRIRARAGLSDVRIHDLRHSFASVGVAGGLSLPVLGGLLGHSQPSTTARYAHLSDDPLRRAVDMIGSRIASAMEPSASQKTGEITPMRAKRRR